MKKKATARPQATCSIMQKMWSNFALYQNEKKECFILLALRYVFCMLFFAPASSFMGYILNLCYLITTTLLYVSVFVFVMFVGEVILLQLRNLVSVCTICSARYAPQFEFV